MHIPLGVDNSAVAHHGVGEEVHRDRDVPSIDVFEEGELVSHSEHLSDVVHAPTAVEGIVHTDMV